MIPDFQTVMLPLLELLADGKPRPAKEVRQHMISLFKLTEEEAAQLIPSGLHTAISDRVSWAQTYMKRAGLTAAPTRGVYEITQRGLELLARKPSRVDVALLGEYPQFKEWLGRSGSSQKQRKAASASESVLQLANEESPEEALDSAYNRLRASIEADLLEQVKNMPPAFFERLVVELLVKMGYGGTLDDAGQAVGKSGDGGIDGIIKEDRLGLDLIHIQAKRWQNTVGRPDIQGFAGSLEGARSKKGIFITTSSFSQEAREYVRHIEKRIVLIDGNQLAQLMYDHGVGASTVATYEIRKVDSDYFVDE
jgi:restriction system protein